MSTTRAHERIRSGFGRMLGAMPAAIAWKPWTVDPVAEATGVSFDRTPAGEIKAPAGQLRVCAYHVDWDERPVCYVDVAELAEARRIGERLTKLCKYNVDYVDVHDETGAIVHTTCLW